MSVERIHEHRAFPNFKLSELPEAERDEAGSIRVNIGETYARATSFWAGRLLYQNCGERRVIEPHNEWVYYQWQLCAARDCAMTIYHFGRLIEGIDISLGSCPALRELIDIDAKKAARKRFERLFPSYITLRMAIAHSAERSMTVKDTKRHGKVRNKTLKVTPEMHVLVGDDASSLLLHDTLHGTTFTSMWEGNLVRCEISEQSGKWLDEIADAYWQAFDAITDPNPEPPPTITWSLQRPPGMG